MRSSFLLAILLAQAAQAQTAALQGTVTDSETHQPLPGVHITALPLDNSDAIPSVAYGAITQRDGTFSIATLKPATYVLIPRRNGYVFTHSSEAGITLKSGEVRTGISIEIIPQAVITGRVTDEFGDPVRFVQVNATLASGAWRVSLSWNTAYVKSNRVAGTVKDGAVLDLTTGAPANDVSLMLAAADASITGTVHDEQDQPAGAQIVLTEDSSDPSIMPGYAIAKADGTYTFPNLPPGSYRIVALQQDTQPPGLFDYGDIMEPIELHAGDKITKELKRRVP